MLEHAPTTPTTYQPPLPFERPPVAVHIYSPGELFPGRAGADKPARGMSETSTTPPSEGVVDPIPTGVIDTTTTNVADSSKRFSASKLASERALNEAKILDIAADELPVTFTGFRAWYHTRRSKKIKSKISDEQHQLDKEREWGTAANKGSMYKNDHRPSSRRENRLSQKKGALVAHKAQKITARKRLEYTDGLVQINPQSGRSTRRKHGSLDHLERSTRRTIRKGEKEWSRLSKHIEHEEHKIVPHSSKKIKRLERKLAKHTDKGRKANIAHDLKPVRQAARSAYRGEVIKAYRGRTEESLAHREQFYSDLGEAIERGITNPDERMNMPRYKYVTEGGAIEYAAAVRAQRHHDIYHSSARGKENSDTDEQPAGRRKNILQQRAEYYKTHRYTSDRRKINQRHLESRRTTTAKQYRKIRAEIRAAASEHLREN